jgi:hypothetical protein
MMNKICTGLMIVGLGGFLGGCVTDSIQPAINKYHVVLAPETMYNCPVVTKWPDINTLTDLQVAKQMVQLASANKVCKTSMNSLHAFYASAAAKFNR